MYVYVCMCDTHTYVASCHLRAAVWQGIQALERCVFPKLALNTQRSIFSASQVLGLKLCTIIAQLITNVLNWEIISDYHLPHWWCLGRSPCKVMRVRAIRIFSVYRKRPGIKKKDRSVWSTGIIRERAVYSSNETFGSGCEMMSFGFRRWL